MRRVEAVCGEGRDVLVTFRPETCAAALRQVRAKCHLEATRSSVVMKGRFQTKAVSLFRTGTLLIHECADRAEALQLLEVLFT